MRKTVLILAFIAATLAQLLPAVPAFAQAVLRTRTFVSAAGNDSNPCSPSLPCRGLPAAFALTVPDGEINVLDPAGYGALTITHGISIIGHGWGAITAQSGDAITINAGTNDKISLHGLVLDGVGTANNGITFNSGAVLDVQDCLIRNFAGTGIDFEPTSSSRLYVARTHIAEIANFGMIIQPQFASAGSVAGALERVEIVDLNANGINFSNNPAGPSLKFTISESLISKALNNGVVVDTGGGPISVMIRNSSITNNTNSGLAVVGAGARARVTKSAITGNGTGISAIGSGIIDSYGDNTIDGNTTDGVPTNTIPAK